MAIDSTLFIGNIPAATYAVGDRIPLSVNRGPAVVRDGYGAAILKRVFSLQSGTANGHIVVKNSNWDDSIANIVPVPAATVLANNANSVQNGQDANLVVNSSWEVYYEFDAAQTISTALDVYVMIDIDYPNVQAVKDPKSEKGTPCTTIRRDAITLSAVGSPLGWTTFNVDILKAGYRYLLSSITYRGASTFGFVSISGAAGQNGLERIIPVLPNSTQNLRYMIDYSTPLVKGPFNINYAGIGSGTDNAVLEIDWVKR